MDALEVEVMEFDYAFEDAFDVAFDVAVAVASAFAFVVAKIQEGMIDMVA